MSIRNTPLTFQRMISNLFSGLIGQGLLVYLNNLIIVSHGVDNLLLKLELILDKVAQGGLKLYLHKCDFLKSRIQFLGHAADYEGIHISDYKISIVKNLPIPKLTNHFF